MATTAAKKKKKFFDPSWKWWGNIDATKKIGIEAFFAAAYFASMPLSIVPLPGGISLLKALSYMIGGVLGIKVFIGRNKLRLNSIHLFLGIYLVYSIFSWFLMGNDDAFIVFRGLLETSMILFLLTMKIYNNRESELVFFSWIVAGLITTVSVFLGMFLGDNTTERVTLYLGGGFEDPNQLCGYFILPMLCCMRKINKKSMKMNILYGSLILLMFYCVLVTGSRGGLIAVVVSLAMYVLLAIPGLKNRAIAAVSFTLIAFIFWSIFFPMLPQDMQERYTVEAVVENRGTGRFDIWEAVINGASQEDFGLIFGYGFAATARFVAASGRDNTVAHNHWIQVLCDQGVVGTLIFFMCFVFGFTRNFKEYPAVSFSILGMFLLSMSLTMYAMYKPFWNVLMMAALNIDDEPFEREMLRRSERGRQIA